MSKRKQVRPPPRVAFTDGSAPVPATMAVDVQPRAGDPFLGRLEHAIQTDIIDPYARAHGMPSPTVHLYPRKPFA